MDEKWAVKRVVSKVERKADKMVLGSVELLVGKLADSLESRLEVKKVDWMAGLKVQTKEKLEMLKVGTLE